MYVSVVCVWYDSTVCMYMDRTYALWNCTVTTACMRLNAHSWIALYTFKTHAVSRSETSLLIRHSMGFEQICQIRRLSDYT